MRRWDGLVDRYINECEQRGLSEATVYGRRLELDRFGTWLKRRRPRRSLEEIDSELCIQYLQARTTFSAKATICRVVTHMRGIGEFFAREGYWQKNPMRWICGPKMDSQSRLPRRLGRKHLKTLWETAYAMPAGFRRERLLAVMAVLYGTGMRRGELIRLDLCHWDRENGRLIVDGRKTGQERIVPVGEAVWRCIEAYLPHRHQVLERKRCTEEQALFVSRHASRLQGNEVSRTVQRLAKQAGVPTFTLHQFRHSCASDLLDSGVTLPDVQRILGHAVICSTMRYTHISGDQRARAIAKHPINQILHVDSDSEGRRAS